MNVLKVKGETSNIFHCSYHSNPNVVILDMLLDIVIRGIPASETIGEKCIDQHYILCPQKVNFNQTLTSKTGQSDYFSL